jgi:adenylate cyclase class IV
MYEVELKVEITAKERESLISLFKKSNFPFKGVTPQNDFYIEAKESPHGGYDLKRYREEGTRFIYTEKIWEMVGGQAARKENEFDVTKDEFESETARFPDAVKIKKQREWFGGAYQDMAISVTIDSVKFDHSPNMRYFIEAEIDVEDKNDVASTKDIIREFLKEFLRKPEIIEAPGMFAMAFKKK